MTKCDRCPECGGDIARMLDRYGTLRESPHQESLASVLGAMVWTSSWVLISLGLTFLRPAPEEGIAGQLFGISLVLSLLALPFVDGLVLSVLHARLQYRAVNPRWIFVGFIVAAVGAMFVNPAVSTTLLICVLAFGLPLFLCVRFRRVAEVIGDRSSRGLSARIAWVSAAAFVATLTLGVGLFAVSPVRNMSNASQYRYWEWVGLLVGPGLWLMTRGLMLVLCVRLRRRVRWMIEFGRQLDDWWTPENVPRRIT